MSFGFGFGLPSQLYLIGSPTLNLNLAGATVLDPIVTFTRASSASYFDSTGTLQSAAIDAPRFDYNPSTLVAQGLLVEEQRTNSIRNNTMQGAVAGTPGTLPTNWQTAFLSGLSYEIVGTGTENGINYTDFRITGTASGISSSSIQFEQNSAIAAAVSQTWAVSAFVKLQAGSLTGISGVRIGWEERSGAFLASQQGVISVATSGSLAASRVSYSATNGNASTTFIKPYINLTPINGATIDFTLRIGLPQLEQGAFATSVIPTTTTALTRAADVASVNTLSPWFNSVEGTIFAEAVRSNIPVAGNANAVDISDGTTSNRSRLWVWSGNPSQMAFTVASGGVTQADMNPGAVSANTIFKVTGAYKANDFATVINGGSAVTDTSGAVPISANIMNIGARSGGSSEFWNGYLRRITYYPRRLSNDELQTLTT